MLDLPLYQNGRETFRISGQRLPVDSECKRCSLHEMASKPCLPGDGRPGGLYVVGKHPGKQEDRAGRVFVGSSGKIARKEIHKHWDGPIAWDNAIRCFPNGKEANDGHIEACAPYLRRTLEHVAPKRILALGSVAMLALLGRSAPIMSIRGGYGWVLVNGRMTPVFISIHSAAADRNPTLLGVFRQDVERALTREDIEEPPYDRVCHVIENEADSVEAARIIRLEAPWFAYDLEWAGRPNGPYFELACAAVCPSGLDEAFVWPRNVLGDERIVSPLIGLLIDPSIGKVGHNIKGDNAAISAAYGVEVKGTYGDTRLWRRLLAANVVAKLGVCSELVGMGGHKEENDAAVEIAKESIRSARETSGTIPLFGFEDPALEAAVASPDEPPERFAYALVLPKIRQRYCALDSISASRLGDEMDRALDSTPGAKWIWDSVVSRSTDAIGQMEMWGVLVDTAGIRTLKEYLDWEISKVEKRLGSYGTFDPSSPAQVGNLLFKQLGLKPRGETAKGGRFSTKKEILRQLRGSHPVVEDILEFRRLDVLRSRYTQSIVSVVGKDGRVNPELKIDGTETGRLSCLNVPLHTLPNPYSTEGKMIKRCFVAPAGCKLLVFDYSQIELRIAAMLSRDEVMIGMFQSGRDFHTSTAKLISKVYWDIEPEEVGSKHRRISKIFNFGQHVGRNKTLLSTGKPKGKVPMAIPCCVAWRGVSTCSNRSSVCSTLRPCSFAWLVTPPASLIRRGLEISIDLRSRDSQFPWKQGKDHSDHNATVWDDRQWHGEANRVLCRKSPATESCDHGFVASIGRVDEGTNSLRSPPRLLLDLVGWKASSLSPPSWDKVFGFPAEISSGKRRLEYPRPGYSLGLHACLNLFYSGVDQKGERRRQSHSNCSRFSDNGGKRPDHRTSRRENYRNYVIPQFYGCTAQGRCSGRSEYGRY